MAMGAAYASKDRAGFNSTELGAAIGSYDAAWAAYRAFGLAEVYAASLYHPYYLCLGARQHPSLRSPTAGPLSARRLTKLCVGVAGTHCNCAFDPPASDLQNTLHAGVGAAVDRLRNLTNVPPGPPPVPAGEPCTTFAGYSCHMGRYCDDMASGQMTDFAHTGSENLSACEHVCAMDPHCSCFIHTDRPDPGAGFEACKTLNHSITSLPTTARGYSAWVKQSK
jgi:hypothetical protein